MRFQLNGKPPPCRLRSEPTFREKVKREDRFLLSRKHGFFKYLYTFWLTRRLRRSDTLFRTAFPEAAEIGKLFFS